MSQLSASRLEQRSGFRNRYRIGSRADFQGDVDAIRLRGRHLQPLSNKSLKSWNSNRDLVATYGKFRQSVITRGGGAGLVFHASIQVFHQNGRAGNNIAGGIGNGARDLTAVALGEHRGSHK